jgi:hypothetical protein
MDRLDLDGAVMVDNRVRWSLRIKRRGGWPHSDFSEPDGRAFYLCSDALFAGLASRSAASRFAVRFFAAARDAFFARAVRSSEVMVSRLRFPPILPPLRPISRITWEISFLVAIASS